jgi:hypothetical protein
MVLLIKSSGTDKDKTVEYDELPAKETDFPDSWPGS